MRVHLVHGFNVSDGGANTTDRLTPYFEVNGHEVIQHDYGWFGFLSVRFRNHSVAEKIAKATTGEGYDVGVGHSNGCAILLDAASMGKFDGLILINPALDRDADIPDGVRWVHVYHNSGDKPVKWAKWLPMHPWGDMGRVGYCGMDGRVMNFSGDRLEPRLSGHSDIFSPDKLPVWGSRLAAWV